MKTIPWWGWSIICAILASVLFLAAMYSEPLTGFLLVSVPSVVALVFWFFQPKYWYRRTVSALIGSWITLSAASKFQFGFLVGEEQFGYLLTENLSWPVHICFFLLIALLLWLDRSQEYQQNRDVPNTVSEQSDGNARSQGLTQTILQVMSDWFTKSTIDVGTLTKEQRYKVLLARERRWHIGIAGAVLVLSINATRTERSTALHPFRLTNPHDKKISDNRNRQMTYSPPDAVDNERQNPQKITTQDSHDVTHGNLTQESGKTIDPLLTENARTSFEIGATTQATVEQSQQSNSNDSRYLDCLPIEKFEGTVLGFTRNESKNILLNEYVGNIWGTEKEESFISNPAKGVLGYATLKPKKRSSEILLHSVELIVTRFEDMPEFIPDVHTQGVLPAFESSFLLHKKVTEPSPKSPWTYPMQFSRVLTMQDLISQKAIPFLLPRDALPYRLSTEESTVLRVIINSRDPGIYWVQCMISLSDGADPGTIRQIALLPEPVPIAFYDSSVDHTDFLKANYDKLHKDMSWIYLEAE